VRLSRIAAVGSGSWAPARGLRLAAGGQPQQPAQVVGHRLEDPGGQPPLRLVVDGLPGREVVGQSIRQEGAPALTIHRKASKTSRRSWVRWGGLLLVHELLLNALPDLIAHSSEEREPILL
jgi:hypothetical protein